MIDKIKRLKMVSTIGMRKSLILLFRFVNLFFNQINYFLRGLGYLTFHRSVSQQASIPALSSSFKITNNACTQIDSNDSLLEVSFALHLFSPSIIPISQITEEETAAPAVILERTSIVDYIDMKESIKRDKQAII